MSTSACLKQDANKNKNGTRGGVANNSTTVANGHGRILEDNPIILSGKSNLSEHTNLNLYLRPAQEYIIDSQFLIGPCTAYSSTITDCFEVRKDANSSLMSSLSGNKWPYSTNTEEFLQVQTFGHIQRITNTFHDYLQYAATQANPGVFQKYETSISQNIYNTTTNPFWFGANKLKGYANCDLENNAYWDASTLTICLGHIPLDKTVFFAHDSSIIYHEMGHAFNQIMLNTRNLAANATLNADLGYLQYDEAGLIGEGISDYFSYMMNKRTHIGEWALGRFLNASRPMHEDDPLHASGISSDSDSRLSYPEHVTYDANNSTLPFADVHNGGQIISHFLVALTDNIKDNCALTEDNAIKEVVYLLIETFGELGDLQGTANDILTTNRKVNLGNVHDSGAYTTIEGEIIAASWLSTVNPINLRKFVQTLSKYISLNLGNATLNRCNGGSYSLDNIEQLLDQYGLLLFKTYNEDGNDETNGHSGTHSPISSFNRVKTVLIPKDLLKLDPRENATLAFILDKASDIREAVQSMTASGQVASTDISSEIDPNFAHNNGNNKISPGEVVGIALNLYNDSNTTMGGVQLLGNDWDHARIDPNDSIFRPCNTFDDGWPLSTEGAADSSAETNIAGDCSYTSQSHGGEAAETMAPVCFVQLNNNNSTEWAIQARLKDEIGLSATKCLGGSASTNDCFARVIKGADQAYYSKIDPNKSWAESIANPDGTPQTKLGNFLFLEVSPWTPPGTTFHCRFRARFTNCDDCFTDSNNNDDDYLDHEFDGATPYKLIHFEFVVND